MKMFKLILCVVLSCGLIKVEAVGEMGPGIWKLKYINKCEEGDHTFKFDLTKKRINRTHDGIDAHIQLDEDFTEAFAIRVDICKEVDGGCKPYQVISEDSFARFAIKYAKDNVKTVFEMCGVDPPEFPLPAGEYDIKDFMFNSEELPTDGPYGEYTARCYMLKGTVEVGCIEIYSDFVEDEE